MKSSQITTLNVQMDVSQIGLTEFVDDLNGLKQLALEISNAFVSAFAPIVESLEETRISVDTLTNALETSTETLGLLLEQLTAGQLEDRVSGIADTVMSGLSILDSLLTSEIGLKMLATVGGAVGTAFAKIGSVIGTGVTQLAGILTGTGGVIALVVVAITAFVVALVAVIVQNWDAIKTAIGTAAEWINTNVIQPVVNFFTELWASITGIVSGIWDGIVAVVSGAAQWFYDNVICPVMEVFNPIVEWFAQLFGSIWQTVSDIFYNIGVIVSGCWDVIVAVWGIVSSWFNDNVIVPVVNFFSGLWDSITAFASEAWTAIQSTFQVVGAWFYQNVIAPVAGFFSGLWEGFLQAASNAWEGVKSVFSAVAGFFGNIFSSAWEKVVSVFSAAGDIFVNIKDAIVEVFKTVVNGIIKGLNSVIAVPFNGINAALNLVKNIEVAGLRPFGGVKTISVPQIPYLAKGAVLPANQPFLAVVGDQRHGTNIEAPLATIQEAVALVMQDQTAAILSGFEASVGVQREILEAVLGIQIGDDVIGSAVTRYTQRQAVIRGGAT